MPAQAALAKARLTPLMLEAKEGLAYSTETRPWPRSAASGVLRAVRVNRLFDLAGAMALEALRGTPVAFDERIHQARPHPGQMQAAASAGAAAR